MRVAHPGLGRAQESQQPDEGGDGFRPIRTARLESILFLSRDPLGSRKLAQLAGLSDGTKARTLVRALNRRYDSEGSAFRVEEVAGGFQLLTRPKYAPWLRRLHSIPLEVRLSAPALETLAVVAYRQPVLRAEIEAIRGVQCGEVLRQLIERDLARIVGRSEELGRPLLYGTTRQFLQVFGLRHLEDLPQPEFLPITKLIEDSGEPVANSPTQDLQQLHQFREMQEETDMSITIDRKTTPESFGTVSVTPERPFTMTSTVYAAKSPEEDDEDDDEDDEELDDEDDDEPWEEVDDDDDEDEDWEDEDDLEDDDDDWDDDDEDEEEEEEVVE
ncbi:MAG: SMC-Scp complex subunit ScpB [Planctomycetota bacterium]